MKSSVEIHIDAKLKVDTPDEVIKDVEKFFERVKPWVEGKKGDYIGCITISAVVE